MATELNAQSVTSGIGQVCWTEIPATDLQRAQTFYATIFDWTYTPLPSSTEEPEYVMFNKGSMNGAFFKTTLENILSPALPPNNVEKDRVSVRVTLRVESVDKTLEAVEAAGGTVYIPKRQLPNDMGVVAFFTDSERNVMGLWSMH